jgi:hypothetical protein
MHQLLFGVRLVYSILYEGWKVIDSAWNGQALGRAWNSQLSDEARSGLAFLGRYFAQPNLSRTIRDNFGFHYLADLLRGPLAHTANRSDEIVTGKRSANIFYPFAEEIRTLALLQATVPEQRGRLWDHRASEEDMRQAAIRLYEAYRPVQEAFDAFANHVLVKMVKSLPYQTEEFTPPHVAKLSEMSSVLFVEEPS